MCSMMWILFPLFCIVFIYHLHSKWYCVQCTLNVNNKQATLAMPSGLCASFDMKQHVCSYVTHNLITSSS